MVGNPRYAAPIWCLSRLCRYHVLYHLPHLTFLDSSAVQQSELTEAKRRGQFMQVVRPGADDRTDVSYSRLFVPDVHRTDVSYFRLSSHGRQ